jgi:hypothetical protein
MDILTRLIKKRYPGNVEDFFKEVLGLGYRTAHYRNVNWLWTLPETIVIAEALDVTPLDLLPPENSPEYKALIDRARRVGRVRVKAHRQPEWKGNPESGTVPTIPAPSSHKSIEPVPVNGRQSPAPSKVPEPDWGTLPSIPEGNSLSEGISKLLHAEP